MQTKPSPPLPVGIWIRVSSEDQAKGESPEHHRLRAKGYAEAKGWKVIEIYDLSGVSGKSVIDHPETKRMMKDVKEGRITSLIFSKLARLARNTRELLDFADYFRDHNANLVSLSESLDTSSPSGRLFFTMVAAMAHWEREEIADRVAQSVPVRAKLGKSMGGAPTYGYTWQDGKLIPDKKEAPIRALIYSLFKEHKRKKTVARILNERGYRTRKGSKFTDTTIERLLLDPTAKGIRRTNYTKNMGQGKTAGKKPSSDWVLHEVEAVVEEALFEECQDILREQAGQRKPKRKSVQLFGGKTFCICGGKMYVKTGSHKYDCQTCHNKIAILDLEAIFAEELNRFVFSDQELSMYLREGTASLSSKEQELRILEKELEKVKQESEKLYQLYLGGALSIPAFKEKNEVHEERRSQLELSLPKLQAEIDHARITLASQDEVIEGVRDLQSRFHSMPFENRRQIVETVVDRITIGEAEVDISLHCLPHNDGNLATHDQGFMAAMSWKRAG